MSAFSYTIAPYLRVELQELEKARQQILLSQLAPHEATRLRWEACLSRIYFSIRLANLNIRKVSIQSILSPKKIQNIKAEETLVIQHKKAFDYLYQDWLLARKPITTEGVLHLQKLIGDENTKIDGKILGSLLDFIQVNPEHPVIQAGLAHILIIRGLNLSHAAERLARFVAYLFFYNSGYDCQGMLDLEDYFFHNPATYSEAVQKNLTEENVSSFLEFYVLMARQQVDRVCEKLNQKQYDLTYPAKFFLLTERQKLIIGLFDVPGVRISNKTVQEIFKVSQITASRDLAHINSLGLIFSHGKGRSVYYTKE